MFFKGATVPSHFGVYHIPISLADTKQIFLNFSCFRFLLYNKALKEDSEFSVLSISFHNFIPTGKNEF